MKAMAIAVTNLRRTFRMRTNIFFMFVFPMLLILALGATFGGSSTPRLGVVTQGSGPLGTALVNQLERTPHLRVVRVADPRRCSPRSPRGNLDAGLVIPPGYDAADPGRAHRDRPLPGRPDQSSQQLGETVQAAVRRRQGCWALPGSPSPSARRRASRRPGRGGPVRRGARRSRSPRPWPGRRRSPRRSGSSTRAPGPSCCCSCS